MYELMVIARTDSADEVFGKVEKFLKDIDAASVKAEKIGKKILAYPIAKQTEGDYFLYNFEAETQALRGLADKLRLEQDTILRHMLIKVAKVKVSKGIKASKVSNVSIDKKAEVVREKPKVTVTTKARVKESKVSSSSAKASADAKALADRSEDKQVAKVSKVSKVKSEVTSKKVEKTVKSTKKGKK